MGVLHITCLVAALTATVVMADPVMPVMDLGKMDPVDACLFICNICFDDEPKLMMDCVREACMGGAARRELSFLWIGRSCKSYQKLNHMLTKSENRS